MGTNAILKTEIIADKSQFSKTISQAGMEVKSFSSTATKAFSGIGKSLIAGFAGFSLVNLLKGTSDEIDNLVASASKLDIGVQQFQKLSYAAKRSDVEIGTLESGLAKLRMNIAKAQQGNEAAAKSFTAIGLNAADLAKMDLGEAYTKVSEALKTIPSSTAQAGAAINIFGRSGQEQMNLLRSNIAGVGKEFEDIGGGFSDEDIKRFNELDAATDKLAVTLKSKLQEAFIGLAPAITLFADGVVNALKQVSVLQDSFSMLVNDYLAQSRPDAVTGKYNPSFFQEQVDQISTRVNDYLFTRDEINAAAAGDTRLSNFSKAGLSRVAGYKNNSTTLDMSPDAQIARVSAQNGVFNNNIVDVKVKVEVDDNSFIKAVTDVASRAADNSAREAVR